MDLYHAILRYKKETSLALLASGRLLAACWPIRQESRCPGAAAMSL